LFSYLPLYLLVPTLFPYTTLFRSPSYPPPRRGEGMLRPLLHVRLRVFWPGLPDKKRSRSGSVSRILSPPFRPLGRATGGDHSSRSEEHTSELQSRVDLVCRLLLEK